ncbi:MAG: dipeptidase, partial [Polyangiales bacterium]
MTPPGRRRLIVIVVATIALVTVALQFGATIADRVANRVRQQAPYVVREEARALYDGAFVVDLHADSLLWERDLETRNDHGAIDLPRLLEGNVAVQCFFLVTKTPYGLTIDYTFPETDVIPLLAYVQQWPRPTWSSYFERARFQARRLHQIAQRSAGTLVVLETKSDLAAFRDARSRGEAKVAAILGVEGAHALDGDLRNLDTLFNDGVRIIAPTHFFDNDIGGSAHGVERGGLTDLGRAMIHEMESRGILLDLAHASEDTFDDAIAVATQPVIVSHTGVRGTCDTRRNLSDDQLRAIANTGGVVGIGYWERAVCGRAPADIAGAIAYAVDRIGVDHVALGSDFDGGVAVPFDTRGPVLVVEALLDLGFNAAQIRKIVGDNAVR